MKRLFHYVCFVALQVCLSLSVRGQNAMPAMRESVQSRFQQQAGGLIELYQYLHAHPELSFMEEKTSARIAEELQKAGYEVKSGDAKTGDYLDMHIAGATSSGNAFTGHHKSMTVTGKLLRNGKVVGSFTDLRNSMGGAWGGYKGSCTVLHRCAVTIGQDVARFVANPREDADLGDAR